MILKFQVQGSAPKPYEVSIKKDGNKLTATCNCLAGRNGKYCKHRFELFKGSPKGVVGGDIDQIPNIPSMLIGTDVEMALNALKEAEKRLDEIKKEIDVARKAVANAMRN